MGTLRSLAATGDRARGFLKHRDTENTERKNEGEEEQREEKRRGERRVWGKKSVGSR
jgi:hypothetical protein